jgi:PPK2 family polyphosphate:nucleotide phosphotransferase
VGKRKATKTKNPKKPPAAGRAHSTQALSTVEADRHAPARSVREALRVGPGFLLADVDPQAAAVGPADREEAAADLFALEAEVGELHEMLWAQAKAGGTKSLLIVFQGMDTSGKGGATKAMDRLLDPLGFSVVGFGPPTDEEKAHGFLWRHERELPGAGRVRVFDRSHYEAVLVERVRGFATVEEWSARYDRINEWEARLAAGGLTILKCMLHISRDEQKQRLLDRLADPQKHWKYNPGDVEERGRWDAYMEAFQDALVRCSTDVAPWFVVPANRKWHRDWLLGQLLAETLRGMDLAYPPSTIDVAAERARVEAS